jgi:hypothetical protein
MHSDQNASPPRVEVIISPAASPLADRREAHERTDVDQDKLSDSERDKTDRLRR